MYIYHINVRKQVRTLFLEARCTFHGTLNNIITYKYIMKIILVKITGW